MGDMNINLGGIIGLLAGIGIALILSPIDSANPDSYGRAGTFVGFGLAIGAFAGNVVWSLVFDKSNRK
jgi:hypothetical protein